MVTTNTDINTATMTHAETPTASAAAKGGRKPRGPRKGSKAKTAPSPSVSGAASATTGITKGSMILNLLQRKKGASMDEMRGVTGWQAHSVRGFLSAVVRKKLGLELISETGKDGVRRYRVVASGDAGTRAIDGGSVQAG